MLPVPGLWGHPASRGRWYKKLQVNRSSREQTGKAAGQVGALPFCLSELGRTQLYRVDMKESNYSSIDTAAYHQQCDFLEYVMRPQTLMLQPDNQTLKITNSLLWNRKQWPLWKLETGHFRLCSLPEPCAISLGGGRVCGESSLHLNGVFTFRQLGPSKM